MSVTLNELRHLAVSKVLVRVASTTDEGIYYLCFHTFIVHQFTSCVWMARICEKCPHIYIYIYIYICIQCKARWKQTNKLANYTIHICKLVHAVHEHRHAWWCHMTCHVLLVMQCNIHYNSVSWCIMHKFWTSGAGLWCTVPPFI